MKQGTQIVVGIVASLAVIAIGGAVLVMSGTMKLPAQFYPPKMPGDQSNPKIVALFNERIDGLEKGQGNETGELDSSWYPGIIPQAAANARLWFGEVREVVTHCRYGTSYKYNWFMFDLTLVDGRVFPDQIAGTEKCNDEYDTAMRVTFEGGRVVDVKTDGSELTRPLSNTRQGVKATVTGVLRLDMTARPERYYWPTAAPPTPAEEWSKL